MPAADRGLVSCSTRRDRTTRAGILLDGAATDPRTALGAAPCGVLDILRDRKSAGARGVPPIGKRDVAAMLESFENQNLTNGANA